AGHVVHREQQLHAVLADPAMPTIVSSTETGVVHDHVEPRISLSDSLREVGDLVKVGKEDLASLIPAVAADLVTELLGAVRVTSVNDHLCTGPADLAGEMPPEAVRRTGDQNRLLGEWSQKREKTRGGGDVFPFMSVWIKRGGPSARTAPSESRSCGT